MPRKRTEDLDGDLSDGKINKPHQRYAANARERSRMRVLSKAFSRLKTTLPWVPPDTKLSKLDTLRLASSYIAHLKQILDHEETNLHSGGTFIHPLNLTWPFTFSSRTFGSSPTHSPLSSSANKNTNNINNNNSNSNNNNNNQKSVPNNNNNTNIISNCITHNNNNNNINNNNNRSVVYSGTFLTGLDPNNDDGIHNLPRSHQQNNNHNHNHHHHHNHHHNHHNIIINGGCNNEGLSPISSDTSSINDHEIVSH